MIRRLSIWLIVGLFGAALLAGCGSSSNSTSSSQTAPTATTSAAAATSTPTTPPTTSTGAGAVSSQGVQLALAVCKRVIQSSPTIPASTKAKLEGICAKASGGDITAARKAAQQVCVEIINSSQVPAGAAKEQALAACKK